MVVIDPDFLTLSGYDAQTGQRRWQSKVQDEPSGRQTLLVRGASVLLWGGNRMHRIDPRTGARSSVETVPWNADCHLAEEGGACAFACECSLQLADCDTGRTIGERYKKTYVEMFGHGSEPPQSGCFGSGTSLVAGTSKMAMASVEDEKTSMTGIFSKKLVLLGLDRATGKERWRSAEMATLGSLRHTGASPDGKTCWIANHEGDLRVFDCERGAVLWKRAGAGGDAMPSRELVGYEQEQKALFRMLDGEAALFDLRSGAPRWKVALPAGHAAIPAGLAVQLYDITADDAPLSLDILSPKDGSVLARVPMPQKTTLYQDPGGGYYVYGFGSGLVAYTKDGRERARAPKPSAPNPVVGKDFFGFFDKESLVLLDRRDLHEVGATSGYIGVQPGSSLAESLVVYRWANDGKSVGEAMLLRRKAR